jgi:signal transduction histidine kinase
VRVRHRHGDWRWIESYALPLFSDGGEYLGHIGTSLDITERKQFEEALSEADSRKDEFLAMLAHELRGPLAPIRNSIEIMRRTAAPETESVVKTLDRQVSHLVRLVDDLLDVGRISRGRIELRRERLDIRSVVQHAVEAVRPLCDDLDQSLSVDLPTDPAFVDGDPARLAQVLGNLLSNASKFTPAGGRLSIAVDPQSSTPAHVSDSRLRHRNRHRTGADRPDLRSLHADRHFAGAGGRWAGHRPDPGPDPGGHAWRHGRGP